MSIETLEHQTTDLTDLNERAVLGAALVSSAAHERCAAIISGKDFYSSAHERIWDAITYLNGQGTAENRVHADPTLTINRLAEQGYLTAVGGTDYIIGLWREVQTASNATWYATKVLDAARDRRMIAAGTRLVQTGEGHPSAEDRSGILSAISAELEDIASAGGSADPTALLGEELTDTLDALENGGAGGITTGLWDLDQILGGLIGGQVIVCGARPGTGKTVIAQAIGQHVAGNLNIPVLSFTMEMSRREMLTRLLASEAKVNSRHLNLAQPALTEDDWIRLSNAMPRVMDMPLHVCDEESLTPSRLNALIGAFKRKHPNLGLVTIDYLGLMSGDGRPYNRQEEISQISREIKKIAKRHNVPILMLSQLNRKSADRSDGKPVITDLRDSGAVEQDADIVILMHREDQYDNESPRAGEMDLMVVKNRGGRTGDCVVLSQMHYYRLTSNDPNGGGGGGAGRGAQSGGSGGW